MSTLSISHGAEQRSGFTAEALFETHLGGIARRTDRLIAVLLACQWGSAIVTAVLTSPPPWDGGSSRFHSQVWAATLLGATIVSLPIALSRSRPGAAFTRHIIAVAQTLMGVLLIHLSGGRTETHYYTFGSLALLAFYRDWRVLVTASTVVALDQLVTGLVWPHSASGVLAAGSWQWIEYIGWLSIEYIFLIRSCLKIINEMRAVAEREADLGLANEELAQEVTERQRAEEALARMVAILEATTDFVGIADADGRVLYVNAAGRRMVGLSEGDVAKTTISDYFPVWANEIVERECLPASILDGVWEGELSLRQRDGTEIPVSLVGLSHKDSHGDVKYLSTIARDVTERKRTEDEIRLLNSHLERRLNRLNALRQIDNAITESFDLAFSLSTLLDQVHFQLGVDAADVLLLDPGTPTLRYSNGKGFRTDAMQQVPLTLDRCVPGLVASECIPLHLPDLNRATATRPFARAEAIKKEGFVAYSAVPLVSRGVVKGVLEVFHRSPLEAGQEWLDFLEALAGQAAIAIDSATLFQELQRSNAELTVAYDATIEGWSRALDLRDKETEGHTRRVTEMTGRLAQAMGVVGADLVNMRRGAMLHDVGKLGVPDAILLKPGKLTDEEWGLMRRHPTYAHEWLAPIAFLRSALEIPYCHHEMWDGNGYPRGLKGEEIPLAARIFAAVDIWDALRSDRPYRRGWSEQRVRDHIRSLAGTHLDPAVVDAFLNCLASEATESAEQTPTSIGREAIGHSSRRPAFRESGTPAERIQPKRAGALPDVGAHLTPLEMENEADARPGPPASGRSSLTIVVAEDHSPSAVILKRTLEAAGHRVQLASDGEAACRIVEQSQARVLIADWMMPGLHGPELCRRIRSQAGGLYTYVILVTGRSGSQDRLEAMDAGADDFLTKPLDLKQLAARLEVARRIVDANGELERRNAQLTELATTDDLTGLKNRRHFREGLESTFSLAARHGLPLSMVMLDVDHFKSFNDAFGHPAGDDVLKALASILRDQIRPYDLLARHGGEEFVVLLTASDGEGARAVAERMRVAIAGHRWPLRAVTASFGVATIPPDCLSALELVEAADRALYHSKKRGRNLVTHSEDVIQTLAGPILQGVNLVKVSVREGPRTTTFASASRSG